MEGTETQYCTGGRTGGQTNWKVSDAERQCIIVSSAFALWKKSATETWFRSQFPFRKDHWFSQLCSDKCTSRLQTWHVVWCGDAYLSYGQQRWFICGDECLSAFSRTKTDSCFQLNGTRDRLPCWCLLQYHVMCAGIRTEGWCCNKSQHSYFSQWFTSDVLKLGCSSRHGYTSQGEEKYLVFLSKPKRLHSGNPLFKDQKTTGDIIQNIIFRSQSRRLTLDLLVSTSFSTFSSSSPKGVYGAVLTRQVLIAATRRCQV